MPAWQRQNEVIPENVTLPQPIIIDVQAPTSANLWPTSGQTLAFGPNLASQTTLAPLRHHGHLVREQSDPVYDPAGDLGVCLRWIHRRERR